MSTPSTPRAERLHITLYGRCNSGKSTLLNDLTAQDLALVSPERGTTTDPVAKSIELAPLGAVVLTDTAGIDDDSPLGVERVARTERTLEHTDLAVLIVSPTAEADDYRYERELLVRFRQRRLPVLLVVGYGDTLEDPEAEGRRLSELLEVKATRPFVRGDKAYRELLIEGLTALVPEHYGTATITGRLVRRGEVVLLVMPQDASAPKGRLIMPQVQTTRELLDKGCIVVSCTPEEMPRALARLSSPPDLIITDSQAFAQVYAMCPEGVRLTSFSVLMAAYKGDISTFLAGARALDSLTATSRVLIAEACTHAPQTEDIGRVKIPALLRRRCGEGLVVDVVSGATFPDDLASYDLVIHCGACMFNRAHVLSRLARASASGVAITNYGICLAHLTGILDRITYPEPEQGER